MWSDLSLRQRALLIQMGVRAGIGDAVLIRKLYDQQSLSNRFDDGGDKKPYRYFTKKDERGNEYRIPLEEAFLDMINYYHPFSPPGTDTYTNEEWNNLEQLNNKKIKNEFNKLRAYINAAAPDLDDQQQLAALIGLYENPLNLLPFIRSLQQGNPNYRYILASTGPENARRKQWWNRPDSKFDIDTDAGFRSYGEGMNLYMPEVEIVAPRLLKPELPLPEIELEPYRKVKGVAPIMPAQRHEEEKKAKPVVRKRTGLPIGFDPEALLTNYGELDNHHYKTFFSSLAPEKVIPQNQLTELDNVRNTAFLQRMYDIAHPEYVNEDFYVNPMATSAAYGGNLFSTGSSLTDPPGGWKSLYPGINWNTDLNSIEKDDQYNINDIGEVLYPKFKDWSNGHDWNEVAPAYMLDNINDTATYGDIYDRMSLAYLQHNVDARMADRKNHPEKYTGDLHNYNNRLRHEVNLASLGEFGDYVNGIGRSVRDIIPYGFNKGVEYLIGKPLNFVLNSFAESPVTNNAGMYSYSPGMLYLSDSGASNLAVEDVSNNILSWTTPSGVLGKVFPNQTENIRNSEWGDAAFNLLDLWATPKVYKSIGKGINKFQPLKPSFNIEGIHKTLWYKDLVKNYGKNAADSFVLTIQGEGWQKSYFNGLSKKEVNKLIKTYNDIMSLKEKIAGNPDEGKALIGGSAAISTEGTINRSGVVPHDLDISAYTKNPSKDLTKKAYEVELSGALSPENMSAAPIVQTLREATGLPIPVLTVPSLFKHSRKFYRWLRGKNKLYVSPMKNYAPGIGANGVLQGNIKGIPIDIFMSDTPLNEGIVNGMLAAEQPLAWKNYWNTTRFKPRTKDILDVQFFEPYSKTNPLIDLQGNSLWAPFRFESQHLMLEGLPVIRNVETYPASGLYIPSALGFDGKFHPVSNTPVLKPWIEKGNYENWMYNDFPKYFIVEDAVPRMISKVSEEFGVPKISEENMKFLKKDISDYIDNIPIDYKNLGDVLGKAGPNGITYNINYPPTIYTKVHELMHRIRLGYINDNIVAGNEVQVGPNGKTVLEGYTNKSVQTNPNRGEIYTNGIVTGEGKLLDDAYTFSKKYYTDEYPETHLLREKASTNSETRSAISEKATNERGHIVLGKELDEYINNLSNRELFELMVSIGSGYAEDFLNLLKKRRTENLNTLFDLYPEEASKAGRHNMAKKYNDQFFSAPVKKALIEVGGYALPFTIGSTLMPFLNNNNQ